MFLGFFHLNGVIFADEEPLTETPVVAIEVPIEVEIEPVVEDAVEEVVAESGTILTAGDVVLET
ncbi:hypothetical protein KKH82_07020 [Patescibacteria group bacterium]|nr:hypothetical protein [Patescibacteria group bacterium]